MLVLSRKQGEALVFKDQQTGEILAYIKVSRIKGNTVRLAAEAPARVRVLRAELPEAAATPQPEDPAEAESDTAPQEQPSRPVAVQ